MEGRRFWIKIGYGKNATSSPPVSRSGRQVGPFGRVSSQVQFPALGLAKLTSARRVVGEPPWFAAITASEGAASRARKALGQVEV